MDGVKDIEYLAARLNGRRVGLAEGARLRALCALGSTAALAETLLPGSAIKEAAPLQRALAGRLAAEILEIADSLAGPRGELVRGECDRFRLENVRTAARFLESGREGPAPEELFIPLPAELGCGPELAAAGSREELVSLVPAGPLRRWLSRAYAGRPAPVFALETALERDRLEYASELAGRLGGPDGEAASLFCRLNAALFGALLSARLRLTPGAAAAEEPAGAKELAEEAFALRCLAAAGKAPADPGRAVWTLYSGLAGRYFRLWHMTFGAALFYLALRLSELRALGAVSEGLRLKVPAGELAVLAGAAGGADA